MYKFTFMLCLVLLIGVKSNAQKIFSDKRDPFTKERNIITTNIKLTQVLQVGAMARITDTSKRFFLSFITIAIPGLKTEVADSVKYECKLKTAGGKIINGKWFGNAHVPIGMNLYNSYTYIFSEDDIKYLSTSPVSDIKIYQGSFEVKKEDQVSKLCLLLLNKL